MTVQIFKKVSPILAGYESKIIIKFSPQAWDALSLGSGRLISQFRTEIEADEVLHEADSADNTIERSGDNTLLITIPGEVSKNWNFRAVVFDLVRKTATETVAVPGIWRWPVRQRVTRHV